MSSRNSCLLAMVTFSMGDAMRLLTLDLDDTIFPCGAVVARANALLARRLKQAGCVGEMDGPAIQEQIRSVRKAAPSPLTYSELRRRAIAALLDDRDPLSNGNAAASSEELFDAWLDERQAAANELLFPGTVDVLRAVRETHPEAVIGAVTNGRGDPRTMNRLAGIFDFCVSGAHTYASCAIGIGVTGWVPRTPPLDCPAVKRAV